MVYSAFPFFILFILVFQFLFSSLPFFSTPLPCFRKPLIGSYLPLYQPGSSLKHGLQMAQRPSWCRPGVRHKLLVLMREQIFSSTEQRHCASLLYQGKGRLLSRDKRSSSCCRTATGGAAVLPAQLGSWLGKQQKPRRQGKPQAEEVFLAQGCSSGCLLWICLCKSSTYTFFLMHITQFASNILHY